jgi:hypothetical protein
MTTTFGFLNSTHTFFCMIFKQAYLSVFINTVLPLWGKRIKFKKNKGDKINLVLTMTIFVQRHA